MNDQISLTRRTPAYWRVTINHPPLNIFVPDTIPELNEAITAVETDEQVTGGAELQRSFVFLAFDLV